jgi:hypothetical protein
MQYRKEAIPAEAQGLSFAGVVDQTVPDQSMSLHEILERFTRGEPVAVGMPVHDDEESDIDIDKLSRLDLTDQAMLREYLHGVISKLSNSGADSGVPESEPEAPKTSGTASAAQRAEAGTDGSA